MPAPSRRSHTFFTFFGACADRAARDAGGCRRAARLFVSPVTVKSHTHNLYQKLGVSGRWAVVPKTLGLALLGGD